MFRANAFGLARLLTLVALSLMVVQMAAAEPSKKFIKCQNMLDKYSSRHLSRASKATEAYSETVDRLVAKHMARLPEAAQATSNLPKIIDKLIVRYRFDHYRQAFVENVINEIKATADEDGEDFDCPDRSKVNRAYKRNAARYENRLDEIEDAVRERLDIEHLADDEGLVIISFFIHGYADEVNINRLGAIGGGIKFGPISNDEYFRVLKVKAGTYNWSKIWYSTFFGRRTFHVSRRNFDFTVEAGKLNYTGLFVHRSVSLTRALGSTHDRAAIVLTILEQRYPELLDAYEVTNGLDPDDRFIEFYLREKHAAKSEEDSA